MLSHHPISSEPISFVSGAQISSSSSSPSSTSSLRSSVSSSQAVLREGMEAVVTANTLLSDGGITSKTVLAGIVRTAA